LEPDHFERKYHLALERMEREEASFRQLEEQLRRIASRLLLLARGRDDALDGLLERVNWATRWRGSTACRAMPAAVARDSRSARHGPKPCVKPCFAWC
jgi:hypothetical protein